MCKCQPVLGAAHFAARPSFACLEGGKVVDWRQHVRGGERSLTYCVAKTWLLEHMPAFDLHFLPGAVAVNSTSMLDDVIAFALMADKAARWSTSVPLATKLAYVLPYASYHESRQNWRPLFFAKFFGLVANATTVGEAWGRLLAPNVFLDWSHHYWPGSPQQAGSSNAYTIQWASSTAPPVVSPLEFVAYGYGSCSAWATYMSYVGRAVGLPARQAGTPCWNSIFEGVDFRGLSAQNANVSLCWQGGSRERGHGGAFLNNHNWVEVFLPAERTTAAVAEARREGKGGAEEHRVAAGSWEFVNVPPGSKQPGTGLCGGTAFEPSHGCGFDPTTPRGHECDGLAGGPGAAMRDHEIFAITWSKPEDDDEVVDVAGRTLSDGKTPLTPLVWSPALASPLGLPLRNEGLRVINRTEFYRCKPSTY